MTKGRTYPSSCTSAKFTQAERSARSEAAKEYRRERGEERRREKTKRGDKDVCPEIPKCDGCCAMLAAFVGQGRGLLDPPWHSSLSFCLDRVHPMREVPIRVPFFLPVIYEQRQLLQQRFVAGQHSVEATLEWRLEGMGRLLGDRFTRADPGADVRRARDDGLAHDAGSPAADDSHRPAALAEDALRTIYFKNRGKCSLRGHGGPHRLSSSFSSMKPKPEPHVSTEALFCTFPLARLESAGGLAREPEIHEAE